MLREIFRPIENELLAADNLVDRQLYIKSIHIGKFAHLDFSYDERMIRPALVILSSRIFGLTGSKAVTLAGVFQFIHMASRVHGSIPEKDSDYTREDLDPRDGSQFPVLVGDYLYGKFFMFLYQAGMISYLSPLADIICQIHEGGILKDKLTGNDILTDACREVVRKETAELFAGCCAMGARYAGASGNDQEIMRRFGLNIGMASGLVELGADAKYAAGYLENARSDLGGIPDKPEKALLEQIINSISERNTAVRRMVI
jgi:geranylgeranyl pyrophosphate synthase